MTEPPQADEQPAPPPSAAPPPPPPPGAPFASFAARHNLVRPVSGRVFAGVCAALARSTNTDPILWRVIFAVLALFGGAGLLIYVVAWLLLPSDGDTGAPVEALAGRGRSRTSTGLIIFGIIVVAISITGYSSQPRFFTPVLAMALLGGVLLLVLSNQGRLGGPPAPPTAPPPPGPTPATPGEAPFAPHGPFEPLAAPAAAAAAPPARVRRPRSRLGLLIFSLVLVGLGALGLLDAANVLAPRPDGYVALALTLVGLGLVLGAWVGRARGYVAWGVLLCLALGATYAAETTGLTGPGRHHAIAWAPASLAELQDSYTYNVGDATLDLSRLRFTDTTRRDLTVKLDVGNLEIILPPDTDVTVTGQVDVGRAHLLTDSWDGLGGDTHTVTDLGPDGVGGGTLTITADVDLGNLEIHREGQ